VVGDACGQYDRVMEALLERDAELDELSRLLDDPRAGRGRLLLVCGEAGIGKTSLVRAVRDS
jgi:predicted ATPase